MICVRFSPVPIPRTKTIQVPARRTAITQTARALSGYTSHWFSSIRPERLWKGSSGSVSNKWGVWKTYRAPPDAIETRSHYVLIRDFNRFMYRKSKHKEKKQFCMYCLQCFSSQRVLTEQKENCLVINGTQAIRMPTEGENILKFTDYHLGLAAPFVIYADFEAITEKVQTCRPDASRSYTYAYQKHTDCGYTYKGVCFWRSILSGSWVL